MHIDFTDFITGLGIAFFIEGALDAIIPDHMKKMVLEVLSLPAQHIRLTGLLAMALGLALVWTVRG